MPEIAQKLLQIPRNCPKFDYIEGEDFSKKIFIKNIKFFSKFLIKLSHKNAIKKGALKSKIELLKIEIEKVILVRIDSNRNRKIFNFQKSIKIEILLFSKDRIEIENFEIDPALLFIPWDVLSLTLVHVFKALTMY